MEGFPDGTFKGGKIVTRYDLALAMARANAHLDELKTQGRPISPEEQRLIDMLNRTVGTELGLLGVRTDSLERRIQSTEDRTNTLDLKKSNVRLSGFYRLENSFVFRPTNYQDYPFLREYDPFVTYTDRGLTPLKQEAFLRFTGRPVLDGLPVDNIEAFAEIRGLIVGPGNLHPTFSLSPDPTRTFTQAGDFIDDFATGLQDDARVSFNRAHFVVKSKNLTFRAFSNESATDLTDPNVLFTVDTLAPFSGAEINGAIRKFAYSSSVMRVIQLNQPSGIDPRDLTLFNQQTVTTSDVEQVDTTTDTDKKSTKSDIYTMRLSYEPWKSNRGGDGERLLFGGTYVEHALRYDIPKDFFRTVAWDVQYSQRNEGRLDAVASYLVNKAPFDLSAQAFKFDSSYQKKGFLANLKFYSFGPDFRTDVAQNQFVDTDVSFNFHRSVTTGLPDTIQGLPDPSTRGENLFRLQLKNDWLGKDIKAVKNLVLSSLWEIKSWNGDSKNPLFNDDEKASRFYIQALMDVTPRWHVELFSEILKDLRIDMKIKGIQDDQELGTLTNSFRSDWRALDCLSFIVDLQLKDDLDSLDSDDRHFKMVRQKYELAWQAHPRFFIKPTLEWIRSSDIQLTSVPVNPVNDRNLGRVMVETNWVVFPKWAIKNYWIIQQTRNSRFLASTSTGNIRVEDNNTNVIVTENLFNFTPALKLRYTYSYQDTNLLNTNRDPLFLKDINVSNNFAELLYTPSTGTELRLTYGYEYENPNDPFDNGPGRFWRTEKIVQFRAQTDF